MTRTPAAFEARDQRWIVARIGVSLSFFMAEWKGHEVGIVQAYQRVRPLFEGSIRFSASRDLGTSRPIAKSTFAAPLRLTGPAPPKRFGLELNSGKDDSDVGPYTFRLLLPESTKTEAAVFHLGLPHGWADEPAALRALFLDLVDLLPFRFGLCGYATQTGDSIRAVDEACAVWLRRYAAVDSMHDIVMTDYALTRVKGVNWLTALDVAFAKRVGGATGLRKKLAPPVVVHQRPSGVVLEAGPRPLLGDRRSKKEDIGAYRAVSTAIRSLRLRRGPVLPGFQDEAETAAWMARFD